MHARPMLDCQLPYMIRARHHIIVGNQLSDADEFEPFALLELEESETDQ